MRWFLIALLALTACKKDPPPIAKPTTAEADAAFWAWVRGHVDALKQVKTGREPVTAELSAQLEKIEPGLVFELGVGREPFELVISADGELQRFATVKRLVAAAGEVPGTKVIAFRPRKDIEGFSINLPTSSPPGASSNLPTSSPPGALKLGEQKLSGAMLWFTAEKDAQRPALVAVTVYVEGMTEENAEPLRNAAFMLLEAAVGEFDLETKVGAIDLVPAPEKPAPPLKKLKELGATLDRWKP